MLALHVPACTCEERSQHPNTPGLGRSTDSRDLRFAFLVYKYSTLQAPVEAKAYFLSISTLLYRRPRVLIEAFLPASSTGALLLGTSHTKRLSVVKTSLAHRQKLFSASSNFEAVA
jgi:hypothetical protein